MYDKSLTERKELLKKSISKKFLNITKNFNIQATLNKYS